MTQTITFMPFTGDPSSLPFTIECEEKERFRDVVTRAIKALGRKNTSALDGSYEVSTGSADITVDTRDLDLPVDEIIKKFGGVFSLKTGSDIKGPF